jgi:hypothetical protein
MYINNEQRERGGAAPEKRERTGKIANFAAVDADRNAAQTGRVKGRARAPAPGRPS